MSAVREEHPTPGKREVICLCAKCRAPLHYGETLVDNKVYDYAGDLKYIELAHAACMPGWAEPN